MTNREAINALKKNYPKKCKMVDGRLTAGFDDTESELGKALTMAIAALEKQEPKERIMPNSDDILDGIEYHCPNCGRAHKQNSKYDFCIKCGQALLWKDDMRNIARTTKEDTE